MSKLVVRDNQLVLERNGDYLRVTADELYRSIVEGEQVWPDVSPGKNGAPRNLKFSRYPAIPKLVLDTYSATGGPILRLHFFTKGRELKYSSVSEIPDQHFIDSGVWYPIDHESRSILCEVMESLGIKELGPVVSLSLFLKIKRLALEATELEDRTFSDSISPLSFVPSRKSHPDDVQAQLYPYQLDGWNWLRFVATEDVGCILADEMGLGKTLQIISLLSDPGPEPLTPALIVVPGSLLENWSRELTKFSPKLSTLCHHGTRRTGNPRLLRNYHVVITTYETVVRDNSLLLMIEWGVIVLDEAQNIKNPDATRSQAVKKLSRKVAVAVTGTPMENKLTDLWSILDFVVPNYFGDQAEFEKTFQDSPDGAEKLEPFVSPILLRRRIDMVAGDLPERIDIPQAVRMSERESVQYDALRSTIHKKYQKAATLVALSKLRMYCSHPSLVLDNVSLPDEPGFMFSKLERFDEIISGIIETGAKTIVFCTFNKMADILVDHITRKYGVFAATLDGRLPIHERQSLIDRIHLMTQPAVLILNPRAGGSGLNITAANHVIHYNLEWNPALEDQASARSHRIGQTKSVTVHRLFVADTVEEVMDERLRRKRELSNTAIVGVTGSQDDYDDIVAALQRSPLQ